MQRDLFYETVRKRYVLAARKDRINAVKNAKVKPLRDQLNTLNKEYKELLEKIKNRQATDHDYARLYQIEAEMENLKKAIKDRGFVETQLAKAVAREVRSFDKIFTSLCVKPEDVEEPVKAALEVAEAGRLDEASLMIKVVVEEGAAVATGGRRGQL